MVTGTLKSKIDKVWDAFHSGGVTNPLTVIEQISYLLFIRRLDEMQASILGGDVENPIFFDDQEEFRWSRLKDKAPEEMFNIMVRQDGLSNFIKTMNGNGAASGGTNEVCCLW